MNTIGGTPSEYPEVDYIWLGGRPVAAIQGKLAINPAASGGGTMLRSPESSGDSCDRNGDSQSCGLKFVVTDYIGKPVTVIEEGSIAATGTYSAFGQLNRWPMFTASRHFATDEETIADFSVPLPETGNWTSSLRVLLHRAQGTIVLGHEPSTSVVRVNGTFQKIIGSSAHRWTPFETNDDGQYSVVFGGNGASYGVDTEAFEVRINESNSNWWFPNLRFPGQYFDAETELHENWNRFMDPATGTYTTPEPMLQNPNYARRMARRGVSPPPYSYAADNPTYYADPDGRDLHVAWTNYVWASAEQIAQLEKIVEELNNPKGRCACALSSQNKGGDPAWKDRWIQVALDPVAGWAGAAGWTDPIHGIINVDPGLSYQEMAGTIAHEGGHLIFPYRSTHQPYHTPEEDRLFNNPDYHCGGDYEPFLHGEKCSCD